MLRSDHHDSGPATFDGGNWTLTREDPDFHQRFIAEVEQDRIAGRWEASEDQGQTWRKDFDLVFERTPNGTDTPELVPPTT